MAVITGMMSSSERSLPPLGLRCTTGGTAGDRTVFLGRSKPIISSGGPPLHRRSRGCARSPATFGLG